MNIEPGGLDEAVTVTANRQVQTTESSLSTLVARETIVTLPLNGRNPLHLIGLVPGVVGHSAEATSSGGTATTTSTAIAAAASRRRRTGSTFRTR